MSLNIRGVVSHCILAVGVAAALGMSASAQGNIRSVTFYNVKPDRVGDFQAEIKEYNAVMAKGGSDHYASVWMSVTGPRVYALASNYKTWAELDAGPDPKMKEQSADIARITERILDCTESRRRIIDEVIPELSLPDSGKMPTMIRVLTSEIRPERYNDYLALIKSDILPAIKKSGTKDYSIGETRYGGSSSQITSVLGFDKWADLDEGVGAQKALGKEGYQGLLVKVRPLIVSSQSDIYRFQPDLSYMPPATAK